MQLVSLADYPSQYNLEPDMDMKNRNSPVTLALHIGSKG
jgi:hypothetical protein